MAFASGMAILLVGVTLAWAATPGRLPWILPGAALRVAGGAAILFALPRFASAGGWFVGTVEWLVGLSFVASAVALGAPLLPRVAIAIGGAAGALALVLEVLA